MSRKRVRIYRFQVIIEQDEDGVYIASCPALQGCYTQGKTYEEAIKNIKMVEAARAEAIRIISEDQELLNYPLLKSKVKEKAGEFHFE